MYNFTVCFSTHRAIKYTGKNWILCYPHVDQILPKYPAPNKVFIRSVVFYNYLCKLDNRKHGTIDYLHK